MMMERLLHETPSFERDQEGGRLARASSWAPASAWSMRMSRVASPAGEAGFSRLNPGMLAINRSGDLL